jgi:hypothetical protein
MNLSPAVVPSSVPSTPASSFPFPLHQSHPLRFTIPLVNSNVSAPLPSGSSNLNPAAIKSTGQESPVESDSESSFSGDSSLGSPSFSYPQRERKMSDQQEESETGGRQRENKGTNHSTAPLSALHPPASSSIPHSLVDPLLSSSDSSFSSLILDSLTFCLLSSTGQTIQLQAKVPTSSVNISTLASAPAVSDSSFIRQELKQIQQQMKQIQSELGALVKSINSQQTTEEKTSNLVFPVVDRRLKRLRQSSLVSFSEDENHQRFKLRGNPTNHEKQEQDEQQNSEEEEILSVTSFNDQQTTKTILMRYASCVRYHQDDNGIVWACVADVRALLTGNRDKSTSDPLAFIRKPNEALYKIKIRVQAAQSCTVLPHNSNKGNEIVFICRERLQRFIDELNGEEDDAPKHLRREGIQMIQHRLLPFMENLEQN